MSARQRRLFHAAITPRRRHASHTSQNNNNRISLAIAYDAATPPRVDAAAFAAPQVRR